MYCKISLGLGITLRSEISRNKNIFARSKMRKIPRGSHSVKWIIRISNWRGNKLNQIKNSFNKDKCSHISARNLKGFCIVLKAAGIVSVEIKFLRPLFQDSATEMQI